MRRASGLVVVALASSCSLFLNASDKQCTSDGDCARGGNFAGSICGADGLCTKNGAPCTVNKNCIDRFGEPSICLHPDNRCEKLLSPDCTKVLGDPANDDAVLLGSLFSLTGTNQSSGIARARSVEVALNDIKQNVPGIPTAPDGHARTLVMLECDGDADIVRAATHLVKDLHVPAIIGPEASGDTITVSGITVPGGTLLISPSATSNAITNLQDDNLVWRTAPADVLQSTVLLDQLAELEQKYRTDNLVPAATKLKVAFVYLNDAYGGGLYNAVTVSATINGKPLADPSNNGFFLPLQYDLKPVDLNAQVSQVLASNPRPAIIVGLGSTEVITKFMTPLEQGWGAAPRPLYLFADAVHKPELLQAATDDALRKRVRGSIPATPATAAFSSFVLKYQGAFPGPVPQVFGMAGAYDATFLVTYGIATAPKQPITGHAIATGFGRLLVGEKLDVGGANLSNGFKILGAGGTFNIEGASGPLDFDLKTGDVRANIDVWCIAKDGTGAPVFVSSGRFYDASIDKMSGTYTAASCQAN